MTTNVTFVNILSSKSLKSHFFELAKHIESFFKNTRGHPHLEGSVRKENRDFVWRLNFYNKGRHFFVSKKGMNPYTVLNHAMSTLEHNVEKNLPKESLHKKRRIRNSEKFIETLI